MFDQLGFSHFQATLQTRSKVTTEVKYIGINLLSKLWWTAHSSNKLLKLFSYSIKKTPRRWTWEKLVLSFARWVHIIGLVISYKFCISSTSTLFQKGCCPSESELQQLVTAMEGDGTNQYVSLQKFVPTVSAILQQKRYLNFSIKKLEIYRKLTFHLMYLDFNLQAKIWYWELSRH